MIKNLDGYLSAMREHFKCVDDESACDEACQCDSDCDCPHCVAERAAELDREHDEACALGYK